MEALVIWSWLLAPALAHGPAPAALEVLAWADDQGCPEVQADRTPALLRSNIGLYQHAGDGTYAYGCPSRWGDAPQTLAASDPSGTQVIIAGSVGLWYSEDGTCHAAPLPLPIDDIPLSVSWYDGRGVALTRRFSDKTTAVWLVTDGELSLLWRGDDLQADGMMVGPDGVWLAGASPAPSIRRWSGGETLEEIQPLEVPRTPDRLFPRLVDGDALWMVAGVGADQWLWRAEAGTAAEVGETSGFVMGPARVGSRWYAVLDRVVWSADTSTGAWSSTGESVDWTCLREAAERPYVCTLPGVYALRPSQDPLPDTERIFSLFQVDPPDAECGAVEGACETDWLHYGAEVGIARSLASTCPDGPRIGGEDTALPMDTDVGEPSGSGCGCRSVPPAALLPWVPLLALGWRRRRRSREV